MRFFKGCSIGVLALGALAFGTGCQSEAIGPGHRGILFLPDQGGVQHEVLQPGYVSLSCGPFTPETKCPRLDNFRVTYGSHTEEIKTISKEGLAMNLRLTILCRPIIAELYQLDTEIGPTYYDEVIAPEFKSAARSVFAHHSYLDLQKKNENIEHEIATIVRRRTAGKHIEVSSVLLESFGYDPLVAAQVRDTIVAESEAARTKAASENAAAQQKREIELANENALLKLQTETNQNKLGMEAATAQETMKIQSDAQEQTMKLQSDAQEQKMRLQSDAEQKKLQIALQTEEETARLESGLRTKENERKLAEQQAVIDRLKAIQAITQANGEAGARIALASASAAEKKADAAAVTPMQVMMHAYDALAHLGGSGTTVMLGDFSHLPDFLFPRIPAFQNAFTMPWAPYVPPPLTSGRTAMAPRQDPTSPY